VRRHGSGRSRRSGADEVRLFVGIYPPPEVAERLAEVAMARPLPPHRRVPAGQTHVTALFIGPRPKRELDGVAESVERSCAGIGAFELRARRVMTLPERGRPRLIAVETDAPPEILEIHRRLAQRLAGGGGRTPDGFLPHLTVCRFRHGERARRVDEAIDGPAFGVVDVRLMRSVLAPDGARHAEVARFVLGAGAG
jgi:2'-5' RNA ligase